MARRLISTSVASAALLVLLLAGPLHHVAMHSHHDALAHNDAHVADCHGGDSHHSPTENAPAPHSSHTCPVCVLLSIGCVEPLSVVTVGEHQAALTAIIWVASIDVPIADQQLPGARAPPATAIS
jgi:hypothetical protein